MLKIKYWKEITKLFIIIRMRFNAKENYLTQLYFMIFNSGL